MESAKPDHTGDFIDEFPVKGKGNEAVPKGKNEGTSIYFASSGAYRHGE